MPNDCRSGCRKPGERRQASGGRRVREMDDSMDAVASKNKFVEKENPFTRLFIFSSLMVLLLLMAGCRQSVAVDPTPLGSLSSLPETKILPTFTSSPAPSETIAPVQTLAVGDAQARLLTLLGNNGNCQFPCFWNITPGKNTSQDAQAILVPLSGIANPLLSGFDENGGTILTVYSEGDLETNIVASYNSENQIVSSIFFQAQQFSNATSGDPSTIKPVFDAAVFGDRLQPYMLSNVLSELGVPTAVLISTDGGPERGKNVPGFYFLLFYPDKGLLVSYTSSRQLIGEKVYGCPANAHVEMMLFPANRGDLFPEVISKTRWTGLWPIPADSPSWKPVEMATSMTLQQFYEIYRLPSDECIETPVELWPTPPEGGG